MAASEWAMGLALQEAGAKGVAISSLFNEDAHAGAYTILRLSGLAEALDAARKAGLEEAADLAEQLSHYCGTNVQPAIGQIIAQIRALAHPDSAEGGQG